MRSMSPCRHQVADHKLLVLSESWVANIKMKSKKYYRPGELNGTSFVAWEATGIVITPSPDICLASDYKPGAMHFLSEDSPSFHLKRCSSVHIRMWIITRRHYWTPVSHINTPQHLKVYWQRIAFWRQYQNPVFIKRFLRICPSISMFAMMRQKPIIG